jgi:D-alanine-D-alanine ligase
MKILVLHSDVAPAAPPEEQDTLVAAEAVRAALAARGHDVAKHAYAPGKGVSLPRPDMVFNLVEGVDGKGEGAPQAPRDLARMGLRFTGVSAAAMAITNDKPLTKRMLRDAGLATPDWCMGPSWDGLTGGKWIVKSMMEDASLDLDDGCVVEAAEVPARAAASFSRHGGRWFAEEFIEGREFNIAVLGKHGVPRILPMAEMRFDNWPQGKPRIVGYEAKWEEDSAGWRQTVRAFGVERNEPELAAEIRDACEKVWEIFGLSGFARVDFRVDAAGTPFILEINANPCISPDAGFAAAAAEAGMAYDDLIEELVRVAL